MKNKKQLLFLLVTLPVAILLIYFFKGSSGQESYIASILEHRSQIDQFMRKSDKSPFLEKLESYKGLDYFPPSPKYNIQASYHPIGNRKIRNLTTSDGKQEEFEEYGYANFELNGVSNKLLILKSVTPGSGSLFIPFADSSSGETTYGGGRYLNIALSGSEFVDLDFNKSYNPYCAYTPEFSCPLPPASNFLAISILAGEKNYPE